MSSKYLTIFNFYKKKIYKILEYLTEIKKVQEIKYAINRECKKARKYSWITFARILMNC